MVVVVCVYVCVCVCTRTCVCVCGDGRNSMAEVDDALPTFHSCEPRVKWPFGITVAKTQCQKCLCGRTESLLGPTQGDAGLDRHGD